MDNHYEVFRRKILIDHLITRIDKKVWDKLHQKIKQFYKSIEYEKKEKIYVDLSHLEFSGNKSTSVKFLLSRKMKRKNQHYKFDY